MLPYNKALKTFSRELRKNQTAAEEMLWQAIRKKQLAAMLFNRQKPIEGYIADFYCAKAKLVIELDGAVHQGHDAEEYDVIRDNVMASLGLTVLRFSNQQIEHDLAGVLAEINVHLTNLPPAPSS
ncbi:endonuclease domain-containing protein [Arsukibacterium sp.]|uniref:endonuclease domain-containing protein n=1 Tax=Arsukibacterium sp. TaxID=1977258 RepID=UPI002FD9A357